MLVSLNIAIALFETVVSYSFMLSLLSIIKLKSAQINSV